MNTAPSAHQFKDETTHLRKIIDQFLFRWPWFIASIFFFLLLAWLYVSYTAPIYQINAKVLINGDKQPGAAQANALMDLSSLLGAKSSIEDEVEVLRTRNLMEQVVRDLKLNIVYLQKDGFLVREDQDAPFQLEIVKGVELLNTVKAEVSKFTNKEFIFSVNDVDHRVEFNKEFVVKELGIVKLTPNQYPFKIENDYVVNIYPFDTRVDALVRQMKANLPNKQVNVINLGLTYPVKTKGEEILAALIKQYTTANLQDKNTIADSTSKFIKDRLNIIAGELGDVEVKQEKFMQNNQLADISEQSKQLVQNTTALTKELATAETQVSIINDLEIYLKDETKNKRIFPTSLFPSDVAFAGILGQYNALLVERDRQLLNKTEENPVIRNIDTQIASLRAGILGNIQSTKNSFLLTRNKLRSQLNQVEGKVSAVPQIEKNYLKLARNQQIKQELYMFLMQKAEETAISKTSNLSIAKTIDPPKAEAEPISPKKIVIYLVALALALALPLAIIYFGNLLNTTVRSREDVVSHTAVPILAEISHNDSEDQVIITNQNRSAIAEQFRALRTNLSFYLKEEDEKVILLTSSISGEGKSFTALNLGSILALAGKKVLLMELDLRKPGLAAKLGISNKIGFSSFMINNSLKATDLIQPLTIHPNLSIISSGPLPPNPAETLMDNRIANLVKELKTQFDYIIMDAPPIGIVTDAQLLAPFADLTIFLVRQNVSKKKHLQIVNELYEAKKMKNIGVVINDINAKYHGYGYGYGEYGTVPKKGFLNKFF